MKTHSFLVLVVAIILFGCANPKPPSGGPPDKTPPKIIEFYPSNLTTKFTDKQIFIVFNKWVDRNSVLNNIFLNPPIKFNAKWSGKKLFIRFIEDLPQDFTINFLLGNDYADLDGNKPNEPFSLFFSTGESIDSGIVVGRVLAKDLTKTFIYVIPTNLISDSLVEINKIFHYRTQPNSNGIFKFEALKPGSYFLFGFTDFNGNKEFDRGLDGFGICSDSVVVNPYSKDTLAILVTHPKDITRPQLVDIVAISKNVIKLKFSEPIRLDSNFDLRYFSINDTSKKIEILPDFISHNPEEPAALLVCFKNKLPEGFYSFELRNFEFISDTSNNKLFFQKPLLFRMTSEIPLLEPDLQTKKKILSNLSQRIVVNFNIPLDTSRTLFRVELVNIEKKDTMPIRFSWGSNFELIVDYPNLRWGSNYILNLSSDSVFDYFGNVFLTRRYSQTISIAGEPSVGNIRGKLLAVVDTSYGKPMIMAMGKDRNYVTDLVGMEWSFDNLPEGEYNLVAFYDRNNSKTYDFGEIYPLKFSEKIIKLIDRVQVKKGWTVEEIKF